MPRLLNLHPSAIWLSLALAALLVVSFVVAGRARTLDISEFEGILIAIPEKQIVAVLEEDRGRLLGTFTDAAGAGAGFITLDPRDRVLLHDGTHLTPFAVNRGTGDTSVYLGLFALDAEEGAKYLDFVYVGDQVMLTDIEIRKTNSAVVRFITADGKNSFAYLVFSPGQVTRAYSVVNADLGDVFVNTPAPNSVLPAGASVSVSGGARGWWYFEGSFPVTLLDGAGRTLAQTIATAEGEWMTENVVPYRAEFILPSGYRGEASLRLERDNPSGLPEHDASLVVPLIIE